MSHPDLDVAALRVLNERYLAELGWAAIWHLKATDPRFSLDWPKVTLADRKRWARQEWEYIHANL